MNKKIIFLGTGTADAIKYFKGSLFIDDGTTNMLVDTGGGDSILSQLEKANISLNNIQNIFISHKHIDHYWGFIWILRFRGAKIAKGEASELTIYCSNKLIELTKKFSKEFLKAKVTDLFGDKIKFVSIDNEDDIFVGNWKIQPINCESDKEEQYGFKLIIEDTSVVFIGDEPYKDELLQQCMDATFFIHNAFCLEKDKEIFTPHKIHHSTVKDAAENAKKLKVKNLILFHTEDKSTYGKRKELYMEESKKYFDGKIFVPDDLESIEI